MERLTTDYQQGNFETMLNYVYSKDGIAYIRSDGVSDDVPLHEWARRECIARGCDEFSGETFQEIDEAICDCALDYAECPIFLAYTFACQACHLRDRLKKYEDTEQDGRLVVLPCKVGDTVWFIRPHENEIAETVIEKMVVKGNGLYMKLSCNKMYETSCNSIGKTVFLTREEAEAALKGGAE